MFDINYNKSSTDWGEVAVNKTGSDDYVIRTVNPLGDKIYAHANSTVYFKTDKPVLVQGALNQDANPVSSCSFYIDDVLIGILKDNRYETLPVSLEAGDYRLTVKAKNNGNAHSFWRVDNATKPKTKIAVVSCVTTQQATPDLFTQAINNKTTKDSLFVDTVPSTENTANRLNSLVQKAIDNGFEAIVVTDSHTVLDSQVLDNVSVLSDGNALEIVGQKVSLKAYQTGKFKSVSRLPVTTVGVAMTASSFVKSGGFDKNDSSIIGNIQSLITRFTNNQGTLCKHPTVIPYIDTDNAEHVLYKSTQNVVPLSDHIKIPKKEFVKVQEELQVEPTVEESSDVIQEDEKPSVKKAVRKTASKTKKKE